MIFLNFRRCVFSNFVLSAGEGALYGVEINAGGIVDTYASFIWEPAVVKVVNQLLMFILHIRGVWTCQNECQPLLLS